jgi:hypothetical protein
MIGMANVWAWNTGSSALRRSAAVGRAGWERGDHRGERTPEGATGRAISGIPAGLGAARRG